MKQRQQQLQQFIERLLMVPQVTSSPMFRDFFHVSKHMADVSREQQDGMLQLSGGAGGGGAGGAGAGGDAGGLDPEQSAVEEEQRLAKIVDVTAERMVDVAQVPPEPLAVTDPGQATARQTKLLAGLRGSADAEAALSAATQAFAQRWLQVTGQQGGAGAGAGGETDQDVYAYLAAGPAITVDDVQFARQTTSAAAAAFRSDLDVKNAHVVVAGLG